MSRIMSDIEKFFYFSLNYKTNYYKWINLWGVEVSDCVPTFIMEINWTCGKDHMISKWESIESNDSWGRMNRFYAELSGSNRRLLEEYVLNGGK